MLAYTLCRVRVSGFSVLLCTAFLVVFALVRLASFFLQLTHKITVASYAFLYSRSCSRQLLNNKHVRTLIQIDDYASHYVYVF